LLCITKTNLPNSHIRAAGLPCVQLPAASKINLLLTLFSFLGEFFYQEVAAKTPMLSLGALYLV
jgi:hypothetical protein